MVYNQSTLQMALVLPVQNPRVSQYIHNATSSQARIDSSKDGKQYDSNVELPDGFPISMDVELAWSGSRLSSDQYIYHFTEDDKLEIAAALTSFKGVKHFNCLHCVSHPQHAEHKHHVLTSDQNSTLTET